MNDYVSWRNISHDVVGRVQENCGCFIKDLGRIFMHDVINMQASGRVLLAIPLYEDGGDNYHLVCNLITKLKIYVGIAHVEKWEILRHLSGRFGVAPTYCKVWCDYWLLSFESKRDAVRFRLKYPESDLEPFKPHGIIDRAKMRSRVQSAGRVRRGPIYSEEEQARRDAADGGLRLVMLKIWGEVKKWATVNRRHHALDLRQAVRSYIETKNAELIVAELSCFAKSGHYIDNVLQILSDVGINVADHVRGKIDDDKVSAKKSQMLMDMIRQAVATSL
ncbi:protein of unknown function [Magnetospirillum sp. XM-1]|uniref:hypothetical protein n=1 Tax=Magnetospirillum sp. XM-1 TaxID=1663591 RepID=UPI00073DF513|nr:hypothetical protein [Magnetospirillum sp. XM-1]CUW41700.1 protein of unknown function [Magnetospirillum sp. XM-1]